MEHKNNSGVKRNFVSGKPHLIGNTFVMASAEMLDITMMYLSTSNEEEN